MMLEEEAVAVNPVGAGRNRGTNSGIAEYLNAIDRGLIGGVPLQSRWCRCLRMDREQCRGGMGEKAENPPCLSA